MYWFKMKYSRQFHPHEDPSSEKWHNYANKSKENQEKTIQFGHCWGMCLIKDNITQSSNCEHEAWC